MFTLIVRTFIATFILDRFILDIIIFLFFLPSGMAVRYVYESSINFTPDCKIILLKDTWHMWNPSFDSLDHSPFGHVVFEQKPPVFAIWAARLAWMITATPLRLCFSNWLVTKDTKKSSLAAEGMPHDGKLHHRTTMWSLQSRTSATSLNELVTHDETSGINVETPERAEPVKTRTLLAIKPLTRSHARLWQS